MKKYYFAYGSNLFQPRLESRVGKVINLGSHRIYGFRLIFNAGFAKDSNAFANVISTGSMENFVEGVVYEMSMKQIKQLDGFEGAPHLYTRCIHSYKGKDLQVYISFNPAYTQKVNMGIEPRVDYMCFVVDGAIQNDLKSTILTISQAHPLVWNKLTNIKK